MIVCLSLVLILYSSHNRYHRIILLAGGFSGTAFDDILEYDIMEDKIHETGHMIQVRFQHTVIVVQAQDYSMWCQ